MHHSNPNKAIGCTITNCTHHFQKQDFCTLPEIMVGTHEADPTVIECTDCESFVLKR